MSAIEAPFEPSDQIDLSEVEASGQITLSELGPSDQIDSSDSEPSDQIDSSEPKLQIIKKSASNPLPITMSTFQSAVQKCCSNSNSNTPYR